MSDADAVFEQATGDIIDVLGGDAVYRVRDSGPVVDPFPGIFSREPVYVSVDGGETEALTFNTSFSANTSDVPAGAGEGDTLEVNSTTYGVVLLEPDGSGLTLIALETM